MALANYSELQASLAAWMARSGDTVITGIAPDAIAMAEAHFNRKLRVADMEANATGASTNGILTLPSDFQAPRVTSIAGYGELELVMPGWAKSAYPSGPEGVAAFYTIQGLTLTTYPAYTGEVSLDYYATIPALSDSDPTNWLLTASPDLYLAQALGHINAFTKNAEAAGLWFSQAAGIIADLNNADSARRYSGASIHLKGSTP